MGSGGVQGGVKNQFRLRVGKPHGPREGAREAAEALEHGGAGTDPLPRGSAWPPPRAGDMARTRILTFGGTGGTPGADYGRVARGPSTVSTMSTTSTRGRECSETPALQEDCMPPENLQPPPEPDIDTGRNSGRIRTYGLIFVLMICPWHSLEEKAEGYSANR